MLIRARVAKSSCAPHISSSNGLNDGSGTGAQVFSGWRLYVGLSVLFAQFVTDQRCCVGLICKNVCPCARCGGSKLSAGLSGKHRVSGRVANMATRTESVLTGCQSAQVSARIALWAAAAFYCRSGSVFVSILRYPQHEFSTDCKVRFCTHMRSSNGITAANSTGSTRFFRLASLCRNSGVFPQVGSHGVCCVRLICKNVCYLC